MDVSQPADLRFKLHVICRDCIVKSREHLGRGGGPEGNRASSGGVFECLPGHREHGLDGVCHVGIVPEFRRLRRQGAGGDHLAVAAPDLDRRAGRPSPGADGARPGL